MAEDLESLRQNVGGSHSYTCRRKRDPFQGLRVGSCLTRDNEFLEEIHVLTKQRLYWEGDLDGEQRGKGTQDSALPLSLASQVLW